MAEAQSRMSRVIPFPMGLLDRFHETNRIRRMELKPTDLILLCPVSSLERATARPLHELGERDFGANDRATVGARLETSVNNLSFAGSRMSVLRLGLSRSEVGRRSCDRPQG